jgi:hypothetical protein
MFDDDPITYPKARGFTYSSFGCPVIGRDNFLIFTTWSVRLQKIPAESLANNKVMAKPAAGGILHMTLIIVTSVIRPPP